jgi:hypothetical protein
MYFFHGHENPLKNCASSLYNTEPIARQFEGRVSQCGSAAAARDRDAALDGDGEQRQRRQQNDRRNRDPSCRPPGVDFMNQLRP